MSLPTHAHRSRRVLVALLAVVALLGAACTSDRDPVATEGEDESRGEGDGGADVSPDFGSLTDVCQDGDGGPATGQGVTEDSIQLGTLTDNGFTQNPEFIDAAEVFTQWCNDNGGINGREVTFEVRDAKLFEYRQRILEACESDFLLVGGGAAFDANGVEDRIECLLPEIPAQTVAPENTQSGLQVFPLADNPEIGPYEGYFRWLLETYPDSSDAIGIIAGDIGATRAFAQREAETMEFLGASIVYDDVYPASGASDWTPYAQALKSEGVEGLVFLGSYRDLAKLEEALVNVDHELAWIDANTNAYNPEFIELAAGSLDRFPNYSAPLIAPFELADDNPATQELLDLYEQYAPDAGITGPAVQAFSAWLLFATSARDCGADVTRSCVFEGASSQTEWDGGGLHAATDLSDPGSREVCFVVVQATPDGFEVPDFAPNEGLFRCEEHEHALEGDYGEPVTLEDVGLTIDDLE